MRNINNLPQSMLLAIHPLKVLLPLLLLISATPSFAAGLTIQYELVARTSETPVPGGGGTFLGFGSAPAIDNNGNVALVASSGLNGVTSQVGVYTFIDGAHQMVADLDTLIPGGGGASFSGFNWDAVDIDGGRVAFRSDFSTITGIYSNVGRATANDLVELVRIGDGEWSGGGDPWVDGGIVAISGTRLVPQQHYTMARINGSSLSANFVDPGTGYNVSTNAQASISGGATIFTRYNSNAAQMGIKSNGNFETLATVSSTASNSSPMPGLDGARFSAFYKYPLVDRDGLDAAFMGWGSQREGLFKRVDGGALQNVVDNTKVIPDSGGDVFQIFSGSRYSLANRQVVFWGSGQSFLKGIYTDIGGGLSVIVDNESNNTIEIDGQTEQIIEIDLGTKSLTYTPQGYMVVFLAYLQSGGSAIIRATIDTGATIPEPDITISGSGAFGDVEIGTSSTHTITISNAGNANLVMGTLSGLASPFSIVSNGCNGTTIAPAASCTVGVRFAPSTTGSRSDTLNIPSNDPDESSVGFGVSGTGTTAAAPDIAVSGNGNFGNVEIGSSGTRSVTVSNAGNANLVIGNLFGLATPFSITSNNCSGATLAPAGACTVSVRFTPTTATTSSDTLIIPSNDPDQANVGFNVSGTGTAAPLPDISVSGNGNFANVEIGSNSTRTITVSNTGNANLVIGSLYGLASPFRTVSNNCSGATLTPAGACTVSVRFTPTAATTSTDTLIIPSNDPDQANTGFNVSGTGIAAPLPDISVGGNGNFGNVEIGSNSTRTITVSNTGNANLVIGSLYGLASPFSTVSNNCSGATLAPAASCTVSVRFTPTASGSRSDTLVIPSNDPDQASVNFGVNGIGIAAPLPNIAVSGNGNFGNVEIGSDSTHTITVSNTGNANLVIGSLYGLASPFSTVSNNCSGATLTPAGACTVSVRFTPTAATTSTDTLIIPSNDPDQANTGFNVSGTGIAAPLPDISVGGNGNFGNVEIGSNSTRTITVSNTGNANLVIGSLYGLASPFSTVSNNCSGATLTPAGSCTVSVRFTPTATTTSTDTLIIPSNDPDQANVGFNVSGTGTAPPGQEVVIINYGFENGNVNGWLLDGAINVDSTESIDQYSLRHKKTGTSTLSVSTAGYSEVSVTMHLAATSLEQGDDCFAEVSTNGGNSWTSVVEVHDGNDNGTFFSNTLSPAGADNNPNLKLRFRSTGKHKPDYCWGDEVTVLGTASGSSDSFTVYKDFSDDNTSSVNISLSCSSGTVTNSPQPASESTPAVFNIDGAEADATCTAVEISVPTGYTPDESDCLDGDPLNGFCTIVNNHDTPPPDSIIVDSGFEDGTVGDWLTSGSVVIDGVLAIGNYSLRHTKVATSVLQVSTIGYTDVSITMHLAATSLDNGEACYAEASTDGGSSWLPVVEVLNGNDDGTFISGSIALASANDNPDLQLRFRSAGGKKPDYCYGDEVLVTGTPTGAN